MIFTSFEFAAFFIVVLLLRSMMPGFGAEKWLLLVASWLFYMSWNPPFVLLLLFTSSLDYFVGLWLERSQEQGFRKLLLVTSLTANLGVLVYFKYTKFLLESWHGLLAAFGVGFHPVVLSIILPAGISFFTFQSMSYTIDVYRREIPACKRMRDFLLCVSFFPQLIAGPIVRVADLLPQLTQKRRAAWKDVESGLALFAIGAIKKLVISDQISGHVETIFSKPGNYDALSLLLGAIGFGVQIYCDFSGYSDMAIACARIMGYEFRPNFRMPYSATSITEFWHRWHISLSTWLRDYLYISLGGNRKGTRRTQVNLMLTMLLGGLWHGAAWTFVIWGGLHGLALIVHKAWRWLVKDKALHAVPAKAGAFAGWALTMAVVYTGWIFFRASTLNNAWIMLSHILTWNHSGVRLLSPQILAAVAILSITHLFVDKDSHWPAWIVDRPMLIRIPAYTFLLMTIICFGARESAPFIYFQF
jgi:alginate O-acetyltransferase complex protein AlgI